MKNKYLYIIILIIVLVVLFFVFQGNKSEAPVNMEENISTTDNMTDQTDSASSPQVTQINQTILATEYSLEDIALHNNENDCWTAVDESVYDLTSWISRHPGGREAILGLCGKDGSSAFNNKHGGQEKQANQLADFKIGILK